ncbi:DUF4440 domain-containing protein [Janibacter sp. CX7]|uniref:nuclear transport factor 2 family protein n=1 Tax=Janibacter sp. CX7 TaxID=2963431 RepID=UPI0020CDA60C|nr:DUF4440 domain-containing protein [Janibacter sp. CX7]UTT67405.1 DUF4440 domain-containing protein [Janibacter sp. CX7]
MPHTDDATLTTVLDLERELQSPETRADSGRVRDLLAPDFEEVGASGRVWDRDSILAMLESEAAEHDSSSIEIDDLRARVIAPGVIRVSWTSAQGERRARRTSIWCAREGGWRQVHHQGTLLT